MTVGTPFYFNSFRFKLSYDPSAQILTCTVTSDIDGGKVFPMFGSQSKEDGPMCSPLPSMTCVELSTLIISYATLRGMNKLDSTKKLVSELLKRERRQQVSELKWFKSTFVN